MRLMVVEGVRPTNVRWKPVRRVLIKANLNNSSGTSGVRWA
jgi:hypothetical protein